MKTILFLLTLLLLSNILNAQNLNKNRLIQIIDSLQRNIDENNENIDALEKSNFEIKIEIDKYKSQLHEVILGSDSIIIFVCMIGPLIYDKPGGYKSLGSINIGDKVKVIESLETFYKVYFNGNMDTHESQHLKLRQR